MSYNEDIMNNYFELKISINPEIEEIVSDICFSNFACEGVVLAEEDWKDLEMTATTRGTLKVFLTNGLNPHPTPLPKEREYLLLEIQSVLNKERKNLKSRGFTDEELGSWEIQLDEKENQDWSKKWKEKWTVTHVTEKIAVVPSWLKYEPKDDEITITLDPGCAFGTGTHQTTQLCMKAIEKYLKKGNSVADIGTGSGILAICAKKFGASTVYGCDNDETVIDVCIENAKVNGLNVYPPLEEGSKSLISGWGKNASHKYSQNTQENAIELRNNATKQEKILWHYLKNSQLDYKFRRQQPIGNYIVDFFCPELKLIIELDGGQHDETINKEYDILRDDFLKSLGYTVLRIWNNEIDKNIDGVINYINNQIVTLVTPPPTPLPQGAGESTRIYFELNTADKLTEKYDFVCANILHNVLAVIMGDLKNIMKSGAKMVLSGILDEKKPVVLDAIDKHGLKIVETLTQDQWVAFVVEK